MKKYINPYTGAQITKEQAIKGAISTGRIATIERVTVMELKRRFPDFFQKLYSSARSDKKK